ncbi:MAG TPA: glycosyltransferase [Planctomycetota bacterium]|nr:glycosyltransferase [Planctomycetota bacterium]
MPLVSILMPVFNAAATLPAALRSISSQTLREWELIAVNDGSGDASLEILDRAAQKDRRIRVLSGAHVGHIESLRSATALASAPLLARMDADDVMHPRRLLVQVTRLDSPPHVDVLATRVRSIGPTGEGMRRYIDWQNGLLSHQDLVTNFFVESPIAHPTVLMRRDIFERAGGYHDPGWAEDFDLWHRMRERGARFEKLPRALLSWRDSDRRLTRTHAMYSEKRFYEAKLYFFKRHPLCKSPVAVWGAGPTGRDWVRDLLRAGIDVPHVIDIDPKKIGRTIANGRVKVVSPDDALSTRPGLILGAVGSRGARDLIRARLLDQQLAEGRDFLFVA